MVENGSEIFSEKLGTTTLFSTITEDYWSFTTIGQL
jgi:hypothetical protein